MTSSDSAAVFNWNPIRQAKRNLALIPVDLTQTPFAAFTSLGGSVESITDVPARLYRGFEMPDGHRLTLSEHDMSADGVRTYRRREDEPERINGLRTSFTAPSPMKVSDMTHSRTRLCR